MDNISSSRIEPLGPGAERDTEQAPEPRNNKKKTRVTAEKETRPVEVEESLELTAEPDERHHLDERA